MNALDRHRALLAAATPGPWHYDFHEGWKHPYVSVTDDWGKHSSEVGPTMVEFAERRRDIIRPDGASPGGVHCTRGKMELERANAKLIAAAVNAHPLLLDLWAAALDVMRDCHPSLESSCAPDVYAAFRDILAKLEAMQ